MQRPIHACVLGFVLCVALFAQTPAGWKMRVDRSASASDPDASGSIKFVTMGAGFHATNPQAAVYWNPANSAAGTGNAMGNRAASSLKSRRRKSAMRWG